MLSSAFTAFTPVSLKYSSDPPLPSAWAARMNLHAAERCQALGMSPERATGMMGGLCGELSSREGGRWGLREEAGEVSVEQSSTSPHPSNPCSLSQPQEGADPSLELQTRGWSGPPLCPGLGEAEEDGDYVGFPIAKFPWNSASEPSGTSASVCLSAALCADPGAEHHISKGCWEQLLSPALLCPFPATAGGTAAMEHRCCWCW